MLHHDGLYFTRMIQSQTLSNTNPPRITLARLNSQIDKNLLRCSTLYPWTSEKFSWKNSWFYKALGNLIPSWEFQDFFWWSLNSKKGSCENPAKAQIIISSLLKASNYLVYWRLFAKLTWAWHLLQVTSFKDSMILWQSSLCRLLTYCISAISWLWKPA
jgi:hypothetical protein